MPASVAQSDEHPTGDTGSIPTRSGNILSWRLIMKYFFMVILSHLLVQEGSCQFLANDCAQILVNNLEDKACTAKVCLGEPTSST